MEKDIAQEFQTACSAQGKGRFAQAEKGYLDILKTHPDQEQVLVALGNLYLDQDRPDKARPVFERSVRLNPQNLPASYSLGRIKQLEADHTGAIEVYKTMLDLQPAAGLVWNNLGVAYRDLGKKEEALSSFQAAVKFAPELAEAWNNLGVARDELNLNEDALRAYRKAIEIRPDYASPHLNIGICLQKAGQFKAADKHYTRVLQLQPDNEIAAFMRHSIRGDEIPDAAPVDHVRSIFDQCADNFEAILVEGLAYKTPELLFHLVRPYLSENMTVLDLGCGTGLGAQLYRPFARRLTGVDVSVKMLEKADEKKVYDRLEVLDILQDWAFPARFDLIYSSDVLVYFGNLDVILGAASSYLSDGGIMAFSVEQVEDNSLDYQLNPSGRYAHSRGYIERCLGRYGLVIKEARITDIRNQSGQPVKGILIVAVKKEVCGGGLTKGEP